MSLLIWHRVVGGAWQPEPCSLVGGLATRTMLPLLALWSHKNHAHANPWVLLNRRPLYIGAGHLALNSGNGQFWAPKMASRAHLGNFGPVLTRLAPLTVRFWPLLVPFGPVLGRFGCKRACPKRDSEGTLSQGNLWWCPPLRTA